MTFFDTSMVANGIRLHARRAGSGPLLVLLHGVTDNGACWGRTAEALAQRFEVLALDQRAHGRTEAPDSGYCLSDLAADVAGVIEVTGRGPAIVIGHSMGGAVGIQLALTHPERVARLIALDPALVRDFGDDAVRYAWFQWARDLQARPLAEVLAAQRAEHPTWPEAELIAWAESKHQVNPRLWGPGGLELGRDFREALVQIPVPITIIRGEPSRGSIVSDEDVAYLAGHAAHIRVWQVPGAGHDLHRDFYEPTLGLIERAIRGE
jgi:lipase